MNYTRIIAYSILSFVICASGTYVFRKKVMHIEGASSSKPDFTIHLKDRKEYGVSLRNDWPQRFIENAKPEKAAIAQAVFDAAVIDPTGQFLYYTKQGPKPLTFSKDLSNYILYRWEIGSIRDSRIIDLGNVTGGEFRFGPLVLKRDGSVKQSPKLFFVRMNEDTDSDGKVSFNDNPSVWQCEMNGESPKKLADIQHGEFLLRVSEDEIMVAVSSQTSSRPRSYLIRTASSKIDEMPEGYEIEFALYDFKDFILGKSNAEGKREYFWFNKKSEVLFPILIDPAFLNSGEVSLVYVKDIRSKIMYIQKLEKVPGAGRINRIYQVNIGERPKQGESLQPELITPPNESCQFFDSTTNKFVFYRTVSETETNVFVIPPEGIAESGPLKIITLGSNVYDLRFSQLFEYMTYVKHFDSDGDGLVLRNSDKAEVFLLHLPREK